MKKTVFWDVALYRSCVNHVQQQSIATCTCWFLARGFFYPRWRRYIPLKRLFTQDLHGATFQKTVFFIVTAVKTSGPTYT
jgi:hypothetical protein